MQSRNLINKTMRNIKEWGQCVAQNTLIYLGMKIDRDTYNYPDVYFSKQ